MIKAITGVASIATADLVYDDGDEVGESKEGKTRSYGHLSA